MELNEDPLPTEPNPLILRLVTKLFGRPNLPARLGVFLTLLILTDYAYSLLREPVIYWFDYSRTVHNPLAGFRFGPFVALAIYLVYAAVLWLVLRILNRKIAITLWGGFVLLHLSTFILYPPFCSYDAQQIFPDWLCHPDRNVVVFIIGLILGLALAWGAYEEQKPAGLAQRGSFLSKLGLSRLSMAIFTAWLLILAVAVVFAARIPTTGWKPILSKHIPPARYEAMVAYNPQSGKALLFGGTVEQGKNNWTEVNDTWEWDGTDWTELTPAQSPPARTRGVMAYDPKRNIIILFGGWDNLKKSLSDTWAWDGKNWQKIGTCETCYPPPARGCQNMFYDTVREEIVMYGGCNENQVYFNDTWSWNGEEWVSIDIHDSPTASGAPIVYDPRNQWAVGFLAWQPTGTWVWDKNGWTKPLLQVEPPLRGNAMMANDPETGDSLMFGGTKPENNSTTFFSDTWAINGTTWREITSSLNPPGRWGHVLFFDARSKRYVLFGGFDGKSVLNDFWEISLTPEK
jgi:hypothetical protein